VVEYLGVFTAPAFFIGFRRRVFPSAGFNLMVQDETAHGGTHESNLDQIISSM
jgi:hypothetical protein